MTTHSDKLAEGVQLVDHSEFRGYFPIKGDRFGVVHSDQILEESKSMDIETKEVRSTADTEHKDAEVKTGTATAPAAEKSGDKA
jgi:hypothetical protein